jgi:hypothetical protein
MWMINLSQRIALNVARRVLAGGRWFWLVGVNSLGGCVPAAVVVSECAS